jgi:hypothetical protein
MPSIKTHMLCWTPAGDTIYPETAGRATLLPHPDRTGATRKWAYTDGACTFNVSKLTGVKLRTFMMSTALGMILRDGLDPKEVHRVLSLLPATEYRDALPEDVR